MDAGPVLPENVSTALIKAINQLKYRQMDELASGEDDLQVGIANKHSWNSKFDQISLTIENEKE